MLEKFGAHFSAAGTQDAPLSQTAESVRSAVIAVLISAAKSDSSFSKAEHDLIARVAEVKLKIPKEKVESFLISADSGQTLAAAVGEVKSKLNETQRQQLLALIWAVIGVDHASLAAEGKFAAQLRTDLGLTLEQALQARKIAEQTKIDGFKEFVEASPAIIEGTHAWAEKKH